MAFSTNGSGAGRGLSSEINVTPLIDVLLVMLIIFMVIVPTLPHGLDSMLPPASKPSSPVPVPPVLLQLEQGQSGVEYRIDGQPIREGELRPHLARLLAERPTRIVLLQGGRALSFSAISGAIDAGYLAGATSVALITPGSAGRQTP